MPGRFLRRRVDSAVAESHRLVEQSKLRLADLIVSADALAETLASINPSDNELLLDYEGRALALAATIAAGRRELARLEELAGGPAAEQDLLYDPFPPRAISPDDVTPRSYDPPA